MPHTTPQTPGLFSLSLSKTVEFALNQALRLDEAQGAAFKDFEDKTFAVTFTDLGLTLYLFFTSYGVNVQNALQGEADARIETDLPSLLGLRETGRLSRVTLHGDVPLAEALIDALTSIEIDWEEHLSHYTGDLIAFKVGHATRSAMAATQAAKRQAGETLKEYLQFELEVLPTASQLQRFGDSVQRTQAAVDAIETRVQALLDRL
ncbi:ubiquinone biosynthesis accessory factor UbiJ [Thiomicrorhabdus cannonii]|uniref:ubiquinone biosynthesis accessory factor UbiJ n=1 Tax=Thiomicrorhabdus cannonii TaxID=2748011 RepID=UPI0015BD0F25|nr:SCP2 sterol-binding domain-containing protein [Thiomicrorhabdus cannonii]